MHFNHGIFDRIYCDGSHTSNGLSVETVCQSNTYIICIGFFDFRLNFHCCKVQRWNSMKLHIFLNDAANRNLPSSQQLQMVAMLSHFLGIQFILRINFDRTMKRKYRTIAVNIIQIRFHDIGRVERVPRMCVRPCCRRVARFSQQSKYLGL